MKKYILILIAGVIVALIAHQSIGFGQVKLAPQKQVELTKELMALKPPVNKLRVVTFQDIAKRMRPNLFDSATKSATSNANVAYDLQTGEVWISAIDGPHPSGATYTHDNAGVTFQSAALVNAGTVPWKGVTITAKFQAIYPSQKWPDGNSVWCQFQVDGPVNGIGNERVAEQIYAGTPKINEIITITSFPRDVPPGATMQPYAYVRASSTFPNRPSGIYAKLLSITINQVAQ